MPSSVAPQGTDRGRHAHEVGGLGVAGKLQRHASRILQVGFDLRHRRHGPGKHRSEQRVDPGEDRLHVRRQRRRTAGQGLDVAGRGTAEAGLQEPPGDRSIVVRPVSEPFGVHRRRLGEDDDVAHHVHRGGIGHRELDDLRPPRRGTPPGRPSVHAQHPCPGVPGSSSRRFRFDAPRWGAPDRRCSPARRGRSSCRRRGRVRRRGRSRSRQSATVRVIGPQVSSVSLSVRIPWRLISPSVGLRPTTPHMLAGRRIEPPASLPRLAKTRRPATAAAEPLDEPPVTRPGSHGFLARPASTLNPKGLQPLSEVLTPPTSMAPAASRRSSTVAVTSGTNCDRKRDPQVARRSRLKQMSLCATGTPCRGPVISPRASAASALRAAAVAASGSTWMNAFQRGWSRSIRSRQAVVTSTDESRLSRIARATSVRLRLNAESATLVRALVGCPENGSEPGRLIAKAQGFGADCHGARRHGVRPGKLLGLTLR